MIVCDTGPLVAAAIARDPDHHRCVELFTGLHLANRPIVVPAPIVAEVGYLLERHGGSRAEAGFLRSLADGDFVPMELIKDDYARMADLVEQYADLPLGTSDASVIALAERLGIPEVATLDLCCGTTIDSEAAPPQVRAHVDHQQQLTKTPETKSEGSGVSHLIFDGSRC